MQAVVFPEPEAIDVQDVPEPGCGDDEVVIRVARAGICGTDLHIYRNEYLSDFPLVPGHEFCGTIVEVGRDIDYHRVGDRVAADPNLDCGHCDYCRRQQNNQCRNWQGVGITRPGAFAEYVAVPGRVAYRLPEDIDDAQAAFIEPLSCVVHAMNRLRVWPGDEAVIFGAGPMGLLLVQMLRHGGASRVIVVEKQRDRLNLARQLGAHEAIEADGREGDRLRELAPDGFAVVVDATGVPAVIERAIAHLRPYGQYLVFGVAPRDASIRLKPFDVFKNDWTILGSFALRYTFEQSIALLSSGAVDVRPLISDRLPLADFRRGFDRFAEGQTLKVHLEPTGAG